MQLLHGNPEKSVTVFKIDLKLFVQAVLCKANTIFLTGASWFKIDIALFSVCSSVWLDDDLRTFDTEVRIAVSCRLISCWNDVNLFWYSQALRKMDSEIANSDDTGCKITAPLANKVIFYSLIVLNKSDFHLLECQ